MNFWGVFHHNTQHRGESVDAVLGLGAESDCPVSTPARPRGRRSVGIFFGVGDLGTHFARFIVLLAMTWISFIEEHYPERDFTDFTI
jgi:hypothetical protein